MKMINEMKIFTVAALCAAMILAKGAPAWGHSVQSPVSGMIERIIIDNPADIWSGGSIKVGGQTVIMPKNMLIDLPANRLTLQQILDQAPPQCRALGETGLALTDSCLNGGPGGFALIASNRRHDGLVVAGDVFIQKGIELLTGNVTYINYTDGYLRVNGVIGDPNSGTIVRINDPDSRHSIQQGLGCDANLGPNCSADPRFTLDPDNYIITFTTAYPACIPSTLPRNGAVAGSAGSDLLGLGDALCPDTNRTVNGGQPVQDATRFAPIRVGDSITAEGNYEVVGGTTFLSTHTLTVNTALTTASTPGVPDYFTFAEVFIDAPGFQNMRARSLFIGFTTRTPARVNIWSLHRDSDTNAMHEFPLASVSGCELSGGPGTCANQGIGIGGGGDIFKIRHDIDFLAFPPDAKLSPCAHLRAGGFDVCPSLGTFAEEFAILSPIPHEIIGRTQNRIDAVAAAPGTPLAVTADIGGNETPWGEYLFPFGIGLGGISLPEMVEINLNQLTMPFIFEGIPWNLDRRLGPGGCDGACDQQAASLCPFPSSELDPRTQAGTPAGQYQDPVFTASLLTFARDRILSFVDGGLGKFNGNTTVLDWHPPVECAESLPADPAVQVVATVDKATYTTDVGAGTSQWEISGIFVGLFPSWNSVVIHIGNDLSGPVLGSALVDPFGNWSFVEPNTQTPPGQTQTISVEFTNGISVLAVPVTLVNI